MNRIARVTATLSCALLALLLLAAPAASAQTGLYGGFNAAHTDFPASKWVYGGNFGLYSEFVKVPPVRVGADLRFSVIRPATNVNTFSTLVGPRVAFHTVGIGLTPYLEGLIGAAHYSFGNNVGSRTKFEYSVLGGVDKAVVPHLDWRVVELAYSGQSTYQYHTNMHVTTISTGVVLRF